MHEQDEVEKCQCALAAAPRSDGKTPASAVRGPGLLRSCLLLLLPGVLLDDINLKGRDEVIAALDAHPKIEIRLFNPFAHRGARGLGFITDFDRKDVFIGSFNLDPRSADINTETGLYVESPELAAQVIAWMDEGISPENSFRVFLDEDGNLKWVTEYGGEEVRFDTDPGSTAWQRFVTGFIRILPVENQL